MTCESCNSTPSGPVRFPGVPFPLTLCRTCVGAGVIPYDVLVTMVWLGKVDVHNVGAQNIALYHGASAAMFEADCANFTEKMMEAFDE